MTMQYLILTPGQEPETINAEPLTYDQMVAIVGYPLEVLNIAGGRATMYMCEEGKQQNFPRNESAQRLANGSIDQSDFIVGTVLVLGPPGAGGNETSLPNDTLAELLEMLR